MKKIIKNMIFLVLIFVICNEKVYAAENENEYINEFVSNIGYDAYVEQKIPLYDLQNKINGWIYILSPNGFVITDENGHFVEANQSLRIEDVLNKIFYAGYNEYYYKIDENIYRHIFSNEKICQDDLSDKITFYNNMKEKLYVKCDFTTFTTTTTVKRLPNSTSTFTSKGTDVEGMGVCGYIAAAIFLDYYNRYIYNGMLPTQYANDYKELINKLYSCGDGGTGISQSALVMVINTFMNLNNKNGYLYMSAATSELYSKYCYSINRDKPAIIVIKNHSTYGHHVVVGHGYYYENVNGNLYNCIIVNDGWGNTNVIINEAYMESVTYSAD